MKLKLKENDIQKTIFGQVDRVSEQPLVLFYDYDETVLYSYTKNDFMNMTQLPSLPNRTNENLVCDGWNWSLSEIKARITNNETICVGAIYHTADDKTHITYRPIETSPTAYICLTPTTANAVTIDWGDGTTDIWTSAAVATKSHTYTGVTDSSVYDIAISCTSGTYSFQTFITGASSNYRCAYIAIKLSNKVTFLGTGCFNNCYYLQKITIPNGITKLPQQCFRYCYSLNSINIPNGVTELGSGCFWYCTSLHYISMPNTITTLGTNALNSIYTRYITLPSSLKNLGEQCLANINSLDVIPVVPNGVTQLPNSCFSSSKMHEVILPSGVTSIGNDCFAYGYYRLYSITIPETVTSMGTDCLFYCYALTKIYMKPTTPPTLGSSTSISNTNPSLVIYVPRGSLSAYQTATNWSSYASKMVEYDY